VGMAVAAMVVEMAVGAMGVVAMAVAMGVAKGEGAMVVVVWVARVVCRRCGSYV